MCSAGRIDSARMAMTAHTVTPIRVERTFNKNTQYTEQLAPSVKPELHAAGFLTAREHVGVDFCPLRRLLSASIVIAMVWSSTGPPTLHVHAYAYADHDHGQHRHGPAPHHHQWATSPADNSARLGACDPAAHTIILGVAAAAATRS